MGVSVFVYCRSIIGFESRILVCSGKDLIINSTTPITFKYLQSWHEFYSFPVQCIWRGLRIYCSSRRSVQLASHHISHHLCQFIHRYEVILSRCRCATSQGCQLGRGWIVQFPIWKVFILVIIHNNMLTYIHTSKQTGKCGLSPNFILVMRAFILTWVTRIHIDDWWLYRGTRENACTPGLSANEWMYTVRP